MRILGWTPSYWHNQSDAQALSQTVRGLTAWEERINRLFSPFSLFIASGTWSDPAFNPIPQATVVNAGAPYDSPYEGHYRSYSKAAFTAAMAFALNRDDWDLLLFLDHDTLLGDIDCNALVREFWKRPEIYCCGQTRKNPEGPLALWKREGAVRMMHYRKTANLLDFEEQRNIVWEEECGHIFRNGRWWDPWPDVACVGHVGRDRWDEMLTWPMVEKPTLEFAQVYMEKNSWKTKPFIK